MQIISKYDPELKDLLFKLIKATKECRETRIKSEMNLL